MAQMQVGVDNSITLPIYTVATTNPSIRGSYVFSIGNVAGVAAANNYISLFNPAASGRVIAFGGAFISSVAGGGTSITNAMQGFRITAASAGTLQASSAVAKFSTSSPNPSAEVRIGNPTVTLGAQVFNSPPVISSTVGSTAVHQVAVPPAAGPFILTENEGVVLRTAAGDVDQVWNLSIVWVEF